MFILTFSKKTLCFAHYTQKTLMSVVITLKRLEKPYFLNLKRSNQTLLMVFESNHLHRLEYFFES